MKHHFNRFQGIINELPAMGINFDDEIHGLLLLESLPNYLECHCLTQMGLSFQSLIISLNWFRREKNRIESKLIGLNRFSVRFGSVQKIKKKSV